MAKREFRLSEQQVNELRQGEQQTRDVRELKRLQAVRLYGTGVSQQDIQNVVGCAERSVREWSQRYQEAGVAGLKSRWRGENALKLSREQRADLKQRLNENRPDQVLPPDLRISRGAFWTVSDLQIAVERWYGVSYRSQGAYRLLLRECGFSYQQAEAVYRSKPDEQTLSDFEADLEKK